MRWKRTHGAKREPRLCFTTLRREADGEDEDERRLEVTSGGGSVAVAWQSKDTENFIGCE